MNYFDIFFSIFLIYFTIRGLFRGLINELMILVSLILGFAIATYYHENVATYLQTAFSGVSISILKVAAFALLFILVTIASRLLAATLNKIVTFTFLQPVNRFAGAIFGLGKALFILGILFNLLNLIPYSEYFLKNIGLEKSILYLPIKSAIGNMYDYISALSPSGINIEQEILNGIDKADSTAKQIIK